MAIHDLIVSLICNRTWHRVRSLTTVLFVCVQSVACSLCVVGFGESILDLFVVDDVITTRLIALAVLVALVGQYYAGPVCGWSLTNSKTSAADAAFILYRISRIFFCPPSLLHVVVPEIRRHSVLVHTLYIPTFLTSFTRYQRASNDLLYTSFIRQLFICWVRNVIILFPHGSRRSCGH